MRFVVSRSTVRALLLGIVIGEVVVGTPVVYMYRHRTLRGRTHYNLMVSPTFTQQQQDTIRQAALKWERAVGNPRALTISIQVGACPVEAGVVESCLIPTTTPIDCSPAGAQAVGCTSRKAGWDYPKVEMDVACGDAHSLSHLVQHEIGHVLGISDNDIKETVMYRTMECGETQSLASQNVSQSDASEYMKGRE